MKEEEEECWICVCVSDIFVGLREGRERKRGVFSYILQITLQLWEKSLFPKKPLKVLYTASEIVLYNQ